MFGLQCAVRVWCEMTHQALTVKPRGHDLWRLCHGPDGVHRSAVDPAAVRRGLGVLSRGLARFTHLYSASTTGWMASSAALTTGGEASPSATVRASSTRRQPVRDSTSASASWYVFLGCEKPGERRQRSILQRHERLQNTARVRQVDTRTAHGSQLKTNEHDDACGVAKAQRESLQLTAPARGDRHAGEFMTRT